MSTPTPNPESDRRHPPFKFFAVVNTNIMKGELIEFLVDAEGRVTSPKLNFIKSATLKLAKLPPT